MFDNLQVISLSIYLVLVIYYPYSHIFISHIDLHFIFLLLRPTWFEFRVLQSNKVLGIPIGFFHGGHDLLSSFPPFFPFSFLFTIAVTARMTYLFLPLGPGCPSSSPRRRLQYRFSAQYSADSQNSSFALIWCLIACKIELLSFVDPELWPCMSSFVVKIVHQN